MKRILLILLTLLVLLTAAACKGKHEQTETTQQAAKDDPYAVLTDSDLPLDAGAEIWEFGEAMVTDSVL